jgi:hypothetical protein
MMALNVPTPPNTNQFYQTRYVANNGQVAVMDMKPVQGHGIPNNTFQIRAQYTETTRAASWAPLNAGIKVETEGTNYKINFGTGNVYTSAPASLADFKDIMAINRTMDEANPLTFNTFVGDPNIPANRADVNVDKDGKLVVNNNVVMGDDGVARVRTGLADPEWRNAVGVSVVGEGADRKMVVDENVQAQVNGGMMKFHNPTTNSVFYVVGNSLNVANGQLMSTVTRYECRDLERKQYTDVHAQFTPDQHGGYSSFKIDLEDLERRFPDHSHPTFQALFPFTGGWSSLDMKSVNDVDGFENAMRKYEYDKMSYEKTVQDLNAKTEVLQQQDRTLELRLKQLDTEQKALQTEMDAVQSVIKNNVEKTFKTFA